MTKSTIDDYQQHHSHILKWRRGKHAGVLFQVCITCTTVIHWEKPPRRWA